MRIHNPNCPECGAPASGTVEHLCGRAEFIALSDDGTTDYSGWTEVFWNEQRTAHQDDSRPESPDNLPLVCCDNGHSWPTLIDW
jgi:hypothetical protein